MKNQPSNQPDLRNTRAEPVEMADFDLPAMPIPGMHGLKYIESFLTAQEEARFLASIDQGTWDQTLLRRTQQFGPKFDYQSRQLAYESILPFPDWIKELAGRVHACGVLQELPDQAIINEYLPGQGIRPHIDRPDLFGDTIVSLTFGGGVMMEFTPIQDSKIVVEQWLAPGSLVSFTDSARYEWRHGISARHSDTLNGVEVARHRRVSVTFRNIKLSDWQPIDRQPKE